MSYDKSVCSTVLLPRVSIPLEQGNLLRRKRVGKYGGASSSQSLWNRAMSYDKFNMVERVRQESLNPFGTGQCLTTAYRSKITQRRKLSIPLEQGNVLRPTIVYHKGSLWCLNPFGTGQCLTTEFKMTTFTFNKKSQSLWNRAMSYDGS